MSGAVLVVLCGLPASGKSTFAKAHAHEIGAFVLTADSVRTKRVDPRLVFAEVNRALTATLADGHSAIVDTCALQSFQRMRWQRVGRRADVRCELVLVDTPWRTCMERDAERKAPAAINWLSAAQTFAGVFKAAQGERWDSVRTVVGTLPYAQVTP